VNALVAQQQNYLDVAETNVQTADEHVEVGTYDVGEANSLACSARWKTLIIVLIVVGIVVALVVIITLSVVLTSPPSSPPPATAPTNTSTPTPTPTPSV